MLCTRTCDSDWVKVERGRVGLQIWHELLNPLLYSLGGQSIDELASEYYVLETFQSTSTGNYDNVDACMKEIISIPTVI